MLELLKVHGSVRYKKYDGIPRDMTLYFITGNSNKLKEAQQILGNIEGKKLDLPEIQERDPRKIIEAKLRAAQSQHQGQFICDDTSLCFDCLGGLPGPFIKWFLEELGPQGLYDLVSKYDNHSATARCIIGYSNGDDIQFFEGVDRGTIVKPRGETTFGWDPIFLPDGHAKTYAQMTAVEKNAISHRTLALQQFKEYMLAKQR